MKNTKYSYCILIIAFCFIFSSLFSQEIQTKKLNNLITVDYIKQNLSKSLPRLVLNEANEKLLRQKLQSDPVVKNIYAAIKLNALDVLNMPFVERKLEGKRLLFVAREYLRRVNCLAMVYRIEKDTIILKRINDELIAVCNFTDWNPNHFLDVAEMSTGVAFALDWTAGDLPASTIEMAQNTLIEKVIKPSYAEKIVGRVYGDSNWGQVCNGGIIAAALTIAEKDPELAAKTLYRSLDGLPKSLDQYNPDGVYPEGTTYWDYGTSYSIITSSMFQTAFGTDFGIADYPGFMKSPFFKLLTTAPSGKYFNFADCGDNTGKTVDFTMSWFATKTGNSNFFDEKLFLIPPKDMGKLYRFAGAALVWISQYEKKGDFKLPTVWKGEGCNPIAIFKNDENDPHQYYFGGKGGKGSNHHGNMDAGSFVFELNGVRWVEDPGNQDYNALESTGFDLWNLTQNSQRWTLLTKNNFGHSTVSVNNQLFVSDGSASIIDFKNTKKPAVTFDLTAVYGKNIKRAKRTFVKENNTSLTINDDFEISDSTAFITWQLITSAKVEIVKGGAILHKDGKSLKINNLTHYNIGMTVVILDPPPLKIDKKIAGLCRIELKIPREAAKTDVLKLKIRLQQNTK